MQPIFKLQRAISQLGNGTVTPNPTSFLDLMATDNGMIISRMTADQRDAIVSPVRGLMVFVIDDSAYYYNNGTPSSPN